MSISNDFLEYILDQLSYWDDVISSKMSGGAGSKPFKPYQDKPKTMLYYKIPPDVLESPDELIRWAKKSQSIQKQKEHPHD